MGYNFKFRPYQRRFRQPLKTRHGQWEIREGIILRLIDDTGQVGWGEIAPLPWFGSETLEQSLNFCQQLPSQITATDIFSIPNELPACQFGFESAWEWGKGDGGVVGKRESLCSRSKRKSEGTGEEQNPLSNMAYSFLLPTGKAALQSWQTAWNQGYRTFKWKIGVASLKEELQLFDQLVQALPPLTKLRLDANGGLTQQQAKQWLKVAAQAGIVEFLEQPLPPEEFGEMLVMSSHYSTPIALDESVATLDQLEHCHQKGWQGIFVIKAAIAGSPKRLRQLCQDYDIDTLFSSVFETAIGRKAALHLAAELSRCDRAVGFGINHWLS